MFRRSLATPLIVAVLVTIATLLTLSTAGPPGAVSAPATAPGIPGKAAPTEDRPAVVLALGPGERPRDYVAQLRRQGVDRPRPCIVAWRADPEQRRAALARAVAHCGARNR